MKQLSAYGLIHLGLWIRILYEAPSVTVRRLLKGLDVFDQAIGRLEMHVSQKALDRLKREVGALDTTDPTVILAASDRETLRDAVEHFETVVTSEAKTRTYFVTVPRRYNTDFLFHSPERLFRDGAFAAMPALARYDFAEACKCIVFDRPTAAAFHMLRGTEDVLKQFYLANVRRNRLKTPMWAGMVDQLRKKQRPPVPEVLLESLDMIRRSYRNPTSHPEARYDIGEAEDLMGLCIDCVNKMLAPAS